MRCRPVSRETFSELICLVSVRSSVSEMEAGLYFGDQELFRQICWMQSCSAQSGECLDVLEVIKIDVVTCKSC